VAASSTSQETPRNANAIGDGDGDLGSMALRITTIIKLLKDIGSD
jgi:hypothetical protein